MDIPQPKKDRQKDIRKKLGHGIFISLEAQKKFLGCLQIKVVTTKSREQREGALGPEMTVTQAGQGSGALGAPGFPIQVQTQPSLVKLRPGKFEFAATPRYCQEL